MGQKVHPTGFRIGVNKSHDSTWYSNYSNYGQTLKEDYLMILMIKMENLKHGKPRPLCFYHFDDLRSGVQVIMFTNYKA